MVQLCVWKTEFENQSWWVTASATFVHQSDVGNGLDDDDCLGLCGREKNSIPFNWVYLLSCPKLFAETTTIQFLSACNLECIQHNISCLPSCLIAGSGFNQLCFTWNHQNLVVAFMKLNFSEGSFN